MNKPRQFITYASKNGGEVDRSRSHKRFDELETVPTTPYDPETSDMNCSPGERELEDEGEILDIELTPLGQTKSHVEKLLSEPLKISTIPSDMPANFIDEAGASLLSVMRREGDKEFHILGNSVIARSHCINGDFDLCPHSACVGIEGEEDYSVKTFALAGGNDMQMASKSLSQITANFFTEELPFCSPSLVSYFKLLNSLQQKISDEFDPKEFCREIVDRNDLDNSAKALLLKKVKNTEIAETSFLAGKRIEGFLHIMHLGNCGLIILKNNGTIQTIEGKQGHLTPIKSLSNPTPLKYSKIPVENGDTVIAYSNGFINKLIPDAKELAFGALSLYLENGLPIKIADKLLKDGSADKDRQLIVFSVST